MSDFEQLKPCPFCGSHPNDGSIGSSVPGMEDCGYLYIECPHCNGASGKPFIGVHGDDKEVLRGIWNTRLAIASMQGEAVGVVTLADDVSQPDTSGEHKGKYQNMIYSHEPLQVGAHVYTHAPDSSARIAELEAENEAMHTTMMAAAVEIQEHWDAHCDNEGYGPANLMHRLERGIADKYGYDAKTVVNMEAEIARLQKELEEARKALQFYADGEHKVCISPWLQKDGWREDLRAKGFWHYFTDNDDHETWIETGQMAESAIRKIGGGE